MAPQRWPRAASCRGRGTASDPWLIANAADWASFAEEVAAGRSTGKHYRLTASVTTDVMVGTEENPFSGTFDGNGQTLTFKYTVPSTDSDMQGVAPFRYIRGATLRNLKATGKITP